MTATLAPIGAHTRSIDPGDTLIDIVDLHDHVIEVVQRREMRARNLRHRSVGIAVVDRDGRVLIHRRADNKDVWPGLWDLAVGGVVDAGESWDRAAVRELAEEVGSNAPIHEIGRGSYEDDAVKAIVRMYVAHDDGPFTFSDGEVVEAFFVSVEELAERLARDSFVPDSVTLMWPLLSGGADGLPTT
ncbi:MAG TPA: NUDIX domain-containing protein [Acidimicrobiales bacterium]|nr:NUDIX domain-containing protein [Acidimicrobiales bacterium]